jgi:hypothetical protein
MKKVIKANTSKYQPTGKHNIISEDFQYILNEYIIPDLKKWYGSNNVVYYDLGGIYIKWSNESKSIIKIQEIEDAGANYVFYISLDGNIKDIYSTDSSERAQMYIEETIENYINSKCDESINSSTDITASTKSGTTFYKITLDQVLDYLKNNDANIWMIKSFEERGFDCLDMKHGFWGSKLDDDSDGGIDNVLYLCVTVGYDIEVDGKLIDPESAFDNYDVEQLSEYIEDADDSILKRYITEDDIETPWLDDWAPDLIQDGNSFAELATAAKDWIDID